MRLLPAIATIAGSMITGTLAFPGMGKIMMELDSSDDGLIPGHSTKLIGDLLAKSGGARSKMGRSIQDALTGYGTAVTDAKPHRAAGPLGSEACSKDHLCAWKHLADEMESVMGDDEGCTDLGRAAIRLGFHDAGAWDVDSAWGGADGSILLAPGELERSENFGLEKIGEVTKGWYDKYHAHGLGMADIIQLGANVGTVVCPDGPRIRTFAGRQDDSRPAPDGKLPDVNADAGVLIELFANKTFTASDLVSLVGAHSTSRQRFVDPTRAGAPQDSSPHYWDMRYYAETLDNAKGLPSANSSKAFSFKSDMNLALHETTRHQWAYFATRYGEERWEMGYANAYFRMSLLGVNNINSLIEISSVIPERRT